MITCKLQGGLGNQLFQIFTTISYAMKNSVSFAFLNTYQLNNGENGTMIRYTYWKNFLSALIPFLKCSNQILIHNVLKEKKFTFENYDITDNTLLVGYFQSSKYFDDYKTPIFKMIKLSTNKLFVKNKVASNYNLIFDNEKKYISLHYRSGDYKKYPNIYPILDDVYYEKSIHAIFELNDYLHDYVKKNKLFILYFCENDSLIEFEEIIEKLKTKFPQLVFEKSPSELYDWEQMLLMSLCNHNIIANSTFSWWGAYFNSHTNKHVCYPKKWFNNELDSCDLCPSDWIGIE
jgi:hypothetical protein